MKKRTIFTIFSILFCLFLTSFTNNISDIDKFDNNVATQEEYIVTMQDIALFLETKKEHYPLSDEFIERYQQKSGGYIENAKKAGLLVDKFQHEPNQKWHFFESWFYPSIEEGTFTLNDSAKSKAYSKLLCPELLLWIYEACEVDPIKVRNAKEVAEQAKVSNTHISTMAKNMRECVPWEDIENTIINYLNSDVESYSVFVNEGTGFVVSGLKNKYRVGSDVTFTINVIDDTKEVFEVKANDLVLKGVSNLKYSFKMPSEEVKINITLKDKTPDIGNPDDGNNDDDNINEEASYLYNIKYDLGTRKTAKLIENIEELYASFEYSGQGNSIINSISRMEYIYGGGYGGSGDNKWVANDMLKFGTGKVNGSLTFSLSSEVNQIKITGYVSDTGCKIQVGDSESNDWTGTNNDNKTSIITCSNMNVTTKDIVESNQTSTLVVDFEKTKNLKIAVTNCKPFYITSIEFMTSK